MKYFKTEASRYAERYEITPENFVRVTKGKYPFEQRSEEGELLTYGICPSCLNSVQLMGIVHEIKNRPHGKHTGKSINGFPVWNQRKYEYCPFAVKNRRKPNDDEKSDEIDDSVIELYNLLREQFDRVVYVIGKEFGILCSGDFWEKTLNQYLVNKAYCYPWLTEANLPYIFAYWGMRHQNLYKQKFLEGSELYNVLANYPDVDFRKAYGNYYRLEKKNGSFIKLWFRFINHTYKVSNGEELKESMLFCVDNIDTGETVFEKRIEFSETYFMSLINKAENENKRQQWLLDIANRLMKPLKCTYFQ